MLILRNLTRVVAAAAIALCTSLAGAATYSNTADADAIFPFGSPDTTSYGQIFNLSDASVLQDWSFYAESGNAGNMRLVVAEWDGSKAVGSELYTGSFAYAGGAQTLAFGGINLSLDSGSYIAYITVAGVASAASNVYTSGSTSDGGLGGAFRFLNSNLADPLTQNVAWDSYYVPNMQFTANIAPVPEPEIYAMMGVGLGLLGWAGRRRRKQQAA